MVILMKRACFSALSTVVVSVCTGACAPASVSGELFGQSFAAADAVVVQNERVAGLLNATIHISELEGLCATEAPAERAKVGVLAATIYGELAPGTYDVVDDYADVDGNKAIVVGARSSDECAAKDSALASKGKITIDDIELKPGGHANGSFEVTIDGNDLTGSFGAPWCPELTEPAGSDEKGCG
jgi:hypothetical protein